jgi:glycolate oxidase FAD binding subunit
MTTQSVLDRLGPDVRDEVGPVPDADRVVAPASLEGAALVRRTAAEHGLRALVWGAGSHQGIGHPVDPDVVISTARLDRIIEWDPDDLTVVVEPGVTVAALEERLAERRQSAVLPEQPGVATVGGVIAAGESGWRRLRYGPTRDRMLEVTLVTGDGRIATAGGRVVKNVTGYDIPRLVVGSLGSLGLIGSVCLKLWPVPEHSGTIPVGDAAEARRTAYRPLAVIETRAGACVYVAGTAEEVAGQAADLGSAATEGLRWPEPLVATWHLSLRVPASAVADAVGEVRRRLPQAWFQAAHGVGIVEIGLDEVDAGAVGDLRAWAEDRTGALVVVRPGAVDVAIDPWGTPPASVELQRAVKRAFDPAGICSPGRLPGRI